MSMLTLKNSGATQFPPGGWGFTDPRTQRVFNGWEGNPQMQAVKIAQHRRANPAIYPPSEGVWFDVNAIIQELYAQKHAKMPWLFRGEPDKGPEYVSHLQQSGPATTVMGAKCECGSTEYVPIYCATCTGKRITGYKCKSCNRQK